MKALSVIDGGKSSGAEQSDVGTKSWAKKARARAKELAGSIETTYMQLAEILYTVYDIPIDGDSKNGPVYMLWGYKSFRDYAEQELGLHYKKAERLRLIWYRLEVELADLDASVKARLVALGHSKVRELVRPGLLNMRNAKAWVEKAEGMNYQSVEASVRAFLDRKEDAEIEAAVRAEGDPVVKSNRLSHEKTTVAEREDAAIEEATGLGKWEDSGKLFSQTYAFFPDQLETVKGALKRAEELTNKSSRGHNLSLICLDFLGNNDFTKASEEQKLRYVAKMEKLIGYKLIVVEPKSKEILFGLATLEKVANKKED